MTCIREWDFLQFFFTDNNYHIVLLKLLQFLVKIELKNLVATIGYISSKKLI